MYCLINACCVSFSFAFENITGNTFSQTILFLEDGMCNEWQPPQFETYNL